MSKGYLVMAQNGYVRHADLLARTIKNTQSTVNNISIITDGEVVNSQLFDHIIPIPEDDLAKNGNWKIHNRAYFYDLSPYDETVILDADMFFLTDVSHWWDLFSKYELLVTDTVRNFRNEIAPNDNIYRKTFTGNNLPNVYSAFVYFKKTDKVKEYFDLVKTIITNWNTFSKVYTPEFPQSRPSMDVAMSVALNILDLKDSSTSVLDYPTFTHMKPGCQGWKSVPDQWSDVLAISTGDDYLRIGPHIQTGIFHYVEKDFIEKVEALNDSLLRI